MTSETVLLSEFCTVRKGLSYKGEYIHQEGPALLGIGTIKEGGGFRPENVRTYGGPYKEEHVLNPGDVYVALTSQDGFLIGSPAMVPKDFEGIGITTHHDAKIDWKIEDPIMQDFLFWLMHSYEFIRHCINFSVGTTVYATHGKDVERFHVPKELNYNQITMTAILNSISELEKSLKSSTILLKEQIKLLFRSWFIDFDPVKANAEGKLPYGMDEETAALFPDSFEDSELGLVPTGWTVGMMEDVLSRKQDSTTPGEHLSGRHYVPIDNIDSKSLTLKNWLPYNEAASSLILFSKNDLLFGAMRPYFHKVTIAPFDGITRSTCFVFTPKVPGTLGFSLCLLNLDSTIRYSTDSSLGSTMPYAIWRNGLARHKIILPPPQIMVAFSAQIAPLIEKIRDGGLKARNLSSARDALLPRLMSGELKVN